MADDIIEVTNLHKRYGPRTAVHDVSFTVRPGEIFGILGPNGAGKTTTVECLAGLRHPDGGQIRVLGLDPQQDRERLRRHVGVQLQGSQLPEKLTVGEALELYRSFYPDPADTGRLAGDLGLTDVQGTRFGKLSGGQRQRLSIALALIGNPTVAVLDELTTGLDPQGRRDTWEVIESIRDSGVTVLLVSHFMDEVERLCDRVAVIDAGRVVAVDTPAGLVARVHTEQRLRFRPRGPAGGPDQQGGAGQAPLPDHLLSGLPEVTRLVRHGDQLTVTGTGDLLHAVTSVLARHQIVAADLRIDQTSLDDAFVALTGHRIQRES